MLQPVFLHREFKAIVQAVSNKLTPQLQAVDEMITGVHYQFGHPIEIINTLGEFTKGETSRFDKYPLVAFFLDSTVSRGEVGYYGEQEINMAIIRASKFPTHTADQRDLYNFIPVLTPIYQELLNQIALRGDLFNIQSAETIPHKYTNRYYWGKEEMYGSKANIFNDWVDAIEINNMRLKININYCPKPIVIPKVDFPVSWVEAV